MAFRAINNAIVIDSLIADLVQEVINNNDQCLTAKESNHNTLGPCQRLFDILGILPCQQDDDTNYPQTAPLTAKTVHERENQITSIDPAEGKPNRKWDCWLTQALAADGSEDEFEIYRKTPNRVIGESITIAVQTEQPRQRKRVTIMPYDRTVRSEPAPCELTRQTVFIDALPAPTPSLQSRPPLADRFCYMLTDFASALYCSLAVMCCCTPSMLR